MFCRGLPWGAIARQQATTQFYDLSSALPGAVSFARASTGTYFNSSAVLQNLTSGSPGFGYDPSRTDKGPGLILEPASQNWAKNAAWTGVVPASDPNSFNTTTGQNSGTWGTLPGNCGLVIPSLADGSTSGWQVVATGTEDGAAYVDIRLKCTNAADPSVANSGKAQRFLFTLASGTGVTASAGQTWSLFCKVKMIAGSFAFRGNARSTLRAVNSGVVGEISDVGLGLSQVGDVAFVSASHYFAAPMTNMTAGVSVVTPGGTSTDVTLRFYMPQIEQALNPSSFIPTNNSAYATRAAASISLATGLGAGTYYLRWAGEWANYDDVITSGSGTLTLTAPASAVAAGDLKFRSLTLSTQPLPPDARKLRYAPPPRTGTVWTVTVSPNGGQMPTDTEINPITGLPYGPDPANRFYDPSLDIIAIMPQRPVTGNLKIIGGKSLTVVGGSFVPTDASGNLNPDLRFCLTCSGQKDWVFLEGLYFDTYGTNIALDACRFSGILEIPVNPRSIYFPDVYVQNININNLHGQKTPNTDHADMFQVTAPIGKLYADNISGVCNYQGFFFPNVNPVLMQAYSEGPYPVDPADLPQMFIEGRALSRVNMSYKGWPLPDSPSDNGAYLWLANSPNDTDPRWPGIDIGDKYPCPTSLNQVYTNSHPGKDWQLSFYPNVSYMVFPNPAQDTPAWHAVFGDGQITAYWRDYQLVSGCVRQGPPTSDFCPSTNCGLGYKSPGYGYVP